MASIKGTGILGVVRLLAERRNHTEPLLPVDLRPYLDRQILVSSWYPEADFLALLRTMVHFTPKHGGDPWRWLGRESARVDLVEIYSSMVQKGSPWGTLQRLPRLWRLYHDTGKAEVGVAGETRAQVFVEGYPFPGEDFSGFMAGYLDTMLELAGAHHRRIRSLRLGSASKPSVWIADWVSG
ncbi:MAG: DUF2378 family protein [Holophagales bacterium]|nr:DUF2378 family protein [Holophagales bacterium]